MKKGRVSKRSTKSGDKSYVYYTIDIPPAIAAKIPADMEFTAELTESGLLFKPTTVTGKVQKLPKWLK